MAAAQKKKINKADYEFKKREGEHDLTKKPGDIDGLAFRMMDLKDCTVSLYDHIAQVNSTNSLTLLPDHYRQV
jgi:hypothetical protein